MKLYTMTELLQLSRDELLVLQRLAEMHLLVLPASAIERREALENLDNIQRALRWQAVRPRCCGFTPPTP